MSFSLLLIVLKSEPNSITTQVANFSLQDCSAFVTLFFLEGSELKPLLFIKPLCLCGSLVKCVKCWKMYAEAGLLFPYFQNFSQEVQQLEEYCKTQKCNASNSMVLSVSLFFFFFFPFPFVLALWVCLIFIWLTGFELGLS